MPLFNALKKLIVFTLTNVTPPFLRFTSINCFIFLNF
nr:MAG TPA: hypothetical protein [Caudoviricetes sp.]